MRVLHALTVASRQTNYDFSLSFGRHVPRHSPGTSVEYVNPLLSRGQSCTFVDLTVVTYEVLSLRSSFAWPEVQFRLEEFMKKSGKTVTFPQDDYTANARLDDFVSSHGLDVYTPIHQDLEKIYRKSHRRNHFELIYTGYFESLGQQKPEPVTVDDYRARNTDLGARVRNLPSYFGEQGRQKALFAQKVCAEAQARGLAVDFSDDESRALLGPSWLTFLSKLRFTIAAKGGASLTDPSGSVSFWYGMLKSRYNVSDGKAFELARSSRAETGDFSALGPRVIEAMASQVALLHLDQPILDGFIPGEHYLAVREDLSNEAEIFAQMRIEKEWVRIVNSANEYLWTNRGLHYSGLIEGLVKRENLNGLGATSPQATVCWGESGTLDSFSHADRMALNQIVKAFLSRPGALTDSTAAFLQLQGIRDKDPAIAAVTEFAESLQSGEAARAALGNSYLFGLSAFVGGSSS